MEKEQMLEKAKEQLSPLETGNLIDFIHNLNMNSIMEHPLVIALFLVVAFYAIIRRSRFVLLFLFAVITIMLLVKYTLSPKMVEGGLTVGTTVPFALGGLVLGGVLIYLTFIKHD